MARAAVYLPIILLLFVFVMRHVEYLVTFHPRAYVPGPSWTPPKNGEDVWINTPSNQKIHGWFVWSSIQPASATVLYCHGNGGDLTDVGWVAEDLAQRGLDVLIFDYRGYGSSEGKLTGEWGLYADADAAYDYLLRERNVKAESLVIYGQSLGTTAAIDLASRRTVKALIVESGLSSASDMGKVAFPWLPRQLHWFSKNKFESIQKIAKVSCPVLVIHGTIDEVIPVDQGRKLFEAAKEPKKLIIIQGGTHNLAGDGGIHYLDPVTAVFK